MDAGNGKDMHTLHTEVQRMHKEMRRSQTRSFLFTVVVLMITAGIVGYLGWLS